MSGGSPSEQTLSRRFRAGGAMPILTNPSQLHMLSRVSHSG